MAFGRRKRQHLPASDVKARADVLVEDLGLGEYLGTRVEWDRLWARDRTPRRGIFWFSGGFVHVTWGSHDPDDPWRGERILTVMRWDDVVSITTGVEEYSEEGAVMEHCQLTARDGTTFTNPISSSSWDHLGFVHAAVSMAERTLLPTLIETCLSGTPVSFGNLSISLPGLRHPDFGNQTTPWRDVRSISQSKEFRLVITRTAPPAASTWLSMRLSGVPNGILAHPMLQHMIRRSSGT